MTDRDLHQRASALFLELRAVPAQDRQRRLDDAVGADESLRREVESLLRHDPGETLAADPCHRGPGGPDFDASPGEPAPDIPARIGPYTILDRLGRGGSGYVLLAEQHEPVRRRVAIKIVPHAAISPDLAARFDFERRALERTEHPNIARVLDAGRTPDGLPYLVMEYVQGEHITEYCRRHNLGLRDRISLMLDVADAVQHAHQRGVIHRDLKPANILVSEASGGASGGGRPTPRVLDFGIAKPIREAYQTEAPPTSGLPMGTPAYMAPEQTGGRAVDTRADVYALGAVLYELACGRPPIQAEEGSDLLDALRRIRDEVPFPASTVRARAIEAGAAPTSMPRPPSAFASDPVPRSLLADLDVILGKSLEKDPARRYPTVAAMAGDLRRLLRSEPIEAHPPTRRYRAARFAQRNRLLVASVAAVILAVALGIAGLTAGLIEARLQRREAVNQTEAQREINQFLTDDLLAPASPVQEGTDVKAIDLLNRASRRVDQRFAGRPLIAGAIHHTLGSAYTELGDFDDAERHLDRAVSLRRAAAGVDAPETVHSELAAASLLARRERFPEAQKALTDAIARARQILGASDPALYAALNDLGSVCESMDKGKEAVALLTEALAGRARLLGPHDPLVLITTSNLAQAYDRLGQTDRSLELMIEALKIADAMEDQPRLIVLGLCNNIGATYQDLNRDQDAAPYLRRAAELAGAWLGADNPDTLTIQANLAGLEAKLGDPHRAAELYDIVVTARTAAMGPDAPSTLTARYGYWDALWHARRFDDAAAGYAALLPDIVRVMGEKHWLAIQTRASMARSLFDAGRPAEALPLAEQAAEQFLALYGPDHARTRTTADLVSRIKAKTEEAAKPVETDRP